MSIKKKAKEWMLVQSLAIAYLLVSFACLLYAVVGGSGAQHDIEPFQIMTLAVGALGTVVSTAFAKMSKRIDALEKLVAERK